MKPTLAVPPQSHAGGRVWRGGGIALLVAMSLLVAACGGASRDSTTPNADPSSWSLPGADLQNTRDVGGPINASNVSTLGVAWTVPVTASAGVFGTYSTTPVVANGVMYTQDIDSNVYAVDVASGKVLWTHNYNSPDVGPNGVSVANGAVYGATDTSAFALEAATGKQLWIQKLVRNANEGIDMAPGFNDGTVYISTVPGNTAKFYAGDGQAVLWALNAATGATKWMWDEVPTDLWSSAHTNINSGGGLWYPPTFDSHGNIYAGLGNPGPFPGAPGYSWGSSRPGPNLYSDSIVKLDAQTGKLIWHYQLTPHDLYDHDLEDSPILSSDNGQPIVIDGGKAGFLVAVNAETGKLVWTRSVGVHNGHDNDNLYAEKGEYSNLHIPEAVEPGDLGGIESQLASNGTTVFAAVNDLSELVKSSEDGLGGISFGAPLGKATGELVAVDEATGDVKWDDRLPSSPYGAATIANNVVFTTTFNGTLYAFEASTGKELWHTTLSAATNAPVAVVGNTVLTAGTFPQGAGQKALIIAYRLGATGTLPTSTPSAPTTTSTKSATTTSTKTAPTTVTSASSPGGVKISTSTVSSLGPILVNAEGRTLYMFIPDKHEKVTCVSTCAELWPPAKLSSGQKAVASGEVKTSLLGSDPDPEGGNVVTYAGWPLYTYAADSGPGTANGQAVNANGGLWYVISPSGKVIEAKP